MRRVIGKKKIALATATAINQANTIRIFWRE
jgi:hypothetical protein